MKVTTLPITRIRIGERARREMRNIDSLARSIKDRGLLQPIVVRPDGDGYALVAGGRRIEAHQLLGLDAIPAHVAESLGDELEALLAENDENTEREEFTVTEKVAHTDRIRAVVESRAAQRKREGQAAGRMAQAQARSASSAATPALDFLEPQPAEVVGGNLPPTTPKESEPKSRDALARTVGLSGRTLDKARHVVEAAKDPEAPPVVREAAREAQQAMDRTGKVDAAFKKVVQVERNALTAPVHDFLDADGRAEHQQLLEWRTEFQKGLARAFRLMGEYPTAQVAANADDELIEELRRLSVNVADYLARVEGLRERPAGLSLVIGG